MGTVLTLGIPGDAVTAIIMGVFIVHGVYPGPQLFTEKPELAYGIFGALVVINLVIMLLLILATRHIVGFVQVEERVLGIIILSLCFIGAYAIGTSLYGVVLALIFGLLGWVCAWLRIPVIPLALGLVMGDFLESSLRQTLNISDGSWLIFVQRPIAATIVGIGTLMTVWPILRPLVPFRKSNGHRSSSRMRSVGKMHAMKSAYIIGTCDTKAPELRYVRDLIGATGIETVLVNVGTKGGDEFADVSSAEVARHHAAGPSAVFLNDRGRAIVEMSLALQAVSLTRTDLGGIIGLGGSGGSGMLELELDGRCCGCARLTDSADAVVSVGQHRVATSDDALDDGRDLPVHGCVVARAAGMAMCGRGILQDSGGFLRAHDLQVTQRNQQRLADREGGNSWGSAFHVDRIGHFMVLALVWLAGPHPRSAAGD